MVDSGSSRPPVRPEVVTAVHVTHLGEAVVVDEEGDEIPEGFRVRPI
jgi:hypothetical protein